MNEHSSVGTVHTKLWHNKLMMIGSQPNIHITLFLALKQTREYNKTWKSSDE